MDGRWRLKAVVKVEDGRERHVARIKSLNRMYAKMERSLVFVPQPPAPDSSEKITWHQGPAPKPDSTSSTLGWIRLITRLSDLQRRKSFRGEAKYILIFRPPALLDVCLSSCRARPTVCAQPSHSRLTHDQKHTEDLTHTLKPGMPKQRCTGVNLPVCLDFECPQCSFLRARCAPDCLKKTWRQELENSCFSAQVVGISDHPKQDSPRGSGRPEPHSHSVSLPLAVSSPCPTPVYLCLFGSLAG